MKLVAYDSDISLSDSEDIATTDTNDATPSGSRFAIDPVIWKTVQWLVVRVCGHLGQPTSVLCPVKLDNFRDVDVDSDLEDEISNEESSEESFDSELQKHRPESSSESSDSDDQLFTKILFATTGNGKRLSKRMESSTERTVSQADKKKKAGRSKTKDLNPDDLPPIEQLSLTLGDSVPLQRLGLVHSIVGTLVVIQSDAELPALDAETVLFSLGDRKSIGEVFEVFGPVIRPLYSVRFNSRETIEEAGLQPWKTVIGFAPTEVAYTKTVFTDSLKKLKGSDASWRNDAEPPDAFLEFSDDEQERQFKAKRRFERLACCEDVIFDEEVITIKEEIDEENLSEVHRGSGSGRRGWRGRRGRFRGRGRVAKDRITEKTSEKIEKSENEKTIDASSSSRRGRYGRRRFRNRGRNTPTDSREPSAGTTEKVVQVEPINLTSAQKVEHSSPRGMPSIFPPARRGFMRFRPSWPPRGEFAVRPPPYMGRFGTPPPPRPPMPPRFGPPPFDGPTRLFTPGPPEPLRFSDPAQFNLPPPTPPMPPNFDPSKPPPMLPNAPFVRPPPVVNKGEMQSGSEPIVKMETSVEQVPCPAMKAKPLLLDTRLMENENV